MTLDRIASRLFGQPHLYDLRKAETVVRQLGPRILGCDIVVDGGVGHGSYVARSCDARKRSEAICRLQPPSACNSSKTSRARTRVTGRCRASSRSTAVSAASAERSSRRTR